MLTYRLYIMLIKRKLKMISNRASVSLESHKLPKIEFISLIGVSTSIENTSGAVM